MVYFGIAASSHQLVQYNTLHTAISFQELIFIIQAPFMEYFLNIFMNSFQELLLVFQVLMMEFFQVLNTGVHQNRIESFQDFPITFQECFMNFFQDLMKELFQQFTMQFQALMRKLFSCDIH